MTQKAKILIAEDELSFAQVLSTYFNAVNYCHDRIERSRNGTENPQAGCFRIPIALSELAQKVIEAVKAKL